MTKTVTNRRKTPSRQRSRHSSCKSSLSPTRIRCTVSDARTQTSSSLSVPGGVQRRTRSIRMRSGSGSRAMSRSQSKASRSEGRQASRVHSRNRQVRLKMKARTTTRAKSPTLARHQMRKNTHNRANTPMRATTPNRVRSPTRAKISARSKQIFKGKSPVRIRKPTGAKANYKSRYLSQSETGIASTSTKRKEMVRGNSVTSNTSKSKASSIGLSSKKRRITSLMNMTKRRSEVKKSRQQSMNVNTKKKQLSINIKTRQLGTNIKMRQLSTNIKTRQLSTNMKTRQLSVNMKTRQPIKNIKTRQSSASLKTRQPSFNIKSMPLISKKVGGDNMSMNSSSRYSLPTLSDTSSRSYINHRKEVRSGTKKKFRNVTKSLEAMKSLKKKKSAQKKHSDLKELVARLKGFGPATVEKLLKHGIPDERALQRKAAGSTRYGFAKWFTGEVGGNCSQARELCKLYAVVFKRKLQRPCPARVEPQEKGTRAPDVVGVAFEADVIAVSHSDVEGAMACGDATVTIEAEPPVMVEQPRIKSTPMTPGLLPEALGE